MAVATTTDRSPEYTGDASTTAFATTFEFFDDSDLVVQVDGVTKTLVTDYTVSGGDGSTGTVTFVAAPASGAKVRIYRSVPYTQPDQFTSTDALPGSTIETRVDRLTMMIQQLAGRIGGVAFTALGYLKKATSTAWEGEGLRLSNIADATAATDAVTKQQLDAATGDAGNVSSPLAGDVGKFWKATGEGQTGWGTPASSIVPTPGASDTDKFITANGGTGDYSLQTAADARTKMGLGTAATKNTGTTDGTVPLVGAGDVLAASVVPAATEAAKGGAELATNAETQTGTDAARVAPVSALKHHLGAAKGWIVFNGTGTVAVLDSYGVSSIADNGTGNYTVNWSTAFTTASYAVLVNAVSNTDGEASDISIPNHNANGLTNGMSTGAVRVQAEFGQGDTKYDPERVFVAAFGRQV